MNMQDKRDCLDSLLFAAAKDAGKNDILEYNSTDGITDLPEGLSEKISGVTKKKDIPKRGHLSFKKKFLIIAAAALLICGMTIGSIAGKKREIADVSVSAVADKYVLTYDTAGIGENGRLSEKVPEALEKEYTYIGLSEDGKGKMYEKDDIRVTYTVTKLTSAYSLVLGPKDNTDHFGILVGGKYNGCAAVTEKDGTAISIVAWNDGECAFELAANMDVDELCAIAGQ